MPAPIVLHYWPTPNGQKISIALEELGLAYEIAPVNIGKGEQFDPAFLAISPNGRMPAIIDPDGPGGEPISIFESGAILQYLGRKTGRLYPQDEPARVEVDQWLFWQVGGLGPMAGQAGHFRNYAPQISPDSRHTAYGANRYVNELHRLYGVMERRLAHREHLAGDYSIADIACWPWIASRPFQGMTLDGFPRLQDWFDRLGARPAVQAGHKAGAELRAPPAKDKAEADRSLAVMFGQRAR